MSETPRTEAQIVTGKVCEDFKDEKGKWLTQVKFERNAEWVFADLARQLELELTQAQARCARLSDALAQIERWSNFPPAEFNGQPCSYGSAYGSNGERDYMRTVAREALKEPR